jgi:hypothetical protein
VLLAAGASLGRQNTPMPSDLAGWRLHLGLEKDNALHVTCKKMTKKRRADAQLLLVRLRKRQQKKG